MTGRIVYHCRARHAYTVAGWRGLIAAAPDMPDFDLETYEAMRDDMPPTPGTHVFTDTDRLDVSGMEAAVALARRVAAAGPGYAVANWPNFVLGRYELLRLLHDSGHNLFCCHRMDERPQKLRYPVFVRRERDHLGSATPLLHSARELAAALRRLLIEQGWRREDVLIVEFVETDRIEGHFAKYAAYCAYGEIHPANMVISTSWVAKADRVASEAAYAAEKVYLESNPHAARLAELFRLANIDYGRIDYGLKDGKIQVFEINTNPELISPAGWSDTERRERVLRPWQVPALRATFRRLARASDRASVLPAPSGMGGLSEFHVMVQRCRAAAERGEAASQLELARMCSQGLWLPRDQVQAYKWLELAISRLPQDASGACAEAVRAREQLAMQMTASQVAEARRLAAEWTPSP
jgi:hypothetical protein